MQDQKKNNKKADITKRKEKKKNNRVNQWQDWIFPICSKSHHGTKSIRAITLTCTKKHAFFTSQRFKIDPREWLAVTNDWYDDKVLLMATVD